MIISIVFNDNHVNLSKASLQATELGCDRSLERCNARLVVKLPFGPLMQRQSRTMKSGNLLPLSPHPLSLIFRSVFFLPMCTPSTQLYSNFSESVVLTLIFFFLQNCCVSTRNSSTHTLPQFGYHLTPSRGHVAICLGASKCGYKSDCK